MNKRELVCPLTDLLIKIDECIALADTIGASDTHSADADFMACLFFKVDELKEKTENWAFNPYPSL